MSLEGAEAGLVKKEPEWEREAAARAGPCIELVAEEPASEADAQAGHIKHVVKEEPAWASEESACGVSAAAAQAGLYTGHTVKGELVVGPEEMHGPKMMSVSERHGVAGRACSVRLERMHVDVERRTIRIGLHTYKLRLYLNTRLDNKTKTETDSSKNICSGRIQQGCRRKQQEIKSSINDRPYKCEHCSFSSTLKYNIKVHSTIHTGEKPYKCAHCSFSTAYKEYLKDHLKTHSGDKPYKCTNCSFSSAHKASLGRHITTHSDDKPYKCAHCIYSSAYKNILDNHMKAHIGEKSYKCTHCSFSTAYKGNLKVHMKTHSVDKPYKCTNCSFSSAYKRSLGRHIKTHSDD